MIPQSFSESMFKIPDDQYYPPIPTFKLNDTYYYNQSPMFPFDREKTIMTEKQEGMLRKLKRLEKAMINMQGLGGYKSVSYNDLCKFLSVDLPVGFMMLKFEKYDGQNNLVSYLRHYCNRIRRA